MARHHETSRATSCLYSRHKRHPLAISCAIHQEQHLHFQHTKETVLDTLFGKRHPTLFRPNLPRHFSTSPLTSAILQSPSSRINIRHQVGETTSSVNPEARVRWCLSGANQRLNRFPQCIRLRFHRRSNNLLTQSPKVATPNKLR